MRKKKVCKLNVIERIWLNIKVVLKVSIKEMWDLRILKRGRCHQILIDYLIYFKIIKMFFRLYFFFKQYPLLRCF